MRLQGLAVTTVGTEMYVGPRRGPLMTTMMISRELDVAMSQYRPSAHGYQIDEALDAFLDSVVLACREHCDSLDDTVDAVGSLIRAITPADVAASDPDWEARWRAYFAFYDHAIMYAIRDYVERESSE